MLSVFLLKWQKVLSKSSTQDFNLAVSWCVLAYWTRDNTVSVTDSWHYAGCKSWENMFSRDVLGRQIKCYAIPSSVTLCGRSQWKILYCDKCVMQDVSLCAVGWAISAPLLKWNIRRFTSLWANMFLKQFTENNCATCLKKHPEMYLI